MNGITRAVLWGLMASGTILLPGCVGAFFRQPVNVEETRDEVDRLREEQAELLALTRELRARLEEQSETLATLRADSNVQMSGIEQRLQVLQAQLEDQGVRFERMQRRTETPSAALPSAGSLSAGTDTLAAASPVGVAPPAGGDATAAAALPEGELYDAAQQDYYRGNYQLALAGFEEYLRNYPDTDLADNAQYWIAECYYGLGDLDRSVQEYLKVRDLYPESNKLSAATLKIGYAFLRKGDKATARRYFETVLREFPDTQEAELARDKLAGLR